MDNHKAFDPDMGSSLHLLGLKVSNLAVAGKKLLENMDRGCVGLGVAELGKRAFSSFFSIPS